MSSAGADWQTNPYTQIRWMRDRSSRANVHRRIDRGEIPPTCACCGCETDIAPTPHSPRCPA